MAVEAENILWFDNMGLAPIAMGDSQEFVMGSFHGVEDGFCFRGLQPLDQQRKEFYPLWDCSGYLGSSSSSSSSLLPCNDSLHVEFVQSLSSELEKQTLETDGFLLLESQRMRSSILHDLTRHQTILLHKLESRIKDVIQQKEEELTIARNKASQLQDFLKRAETEAKSWEKKAMEKEAIVIDLKEKLNQVGRKESLFLHAAQEDDTMSFCGSSSNSTGQKTKINNKKMDCKLCQARKSCVVFFPCRHLCCCNSCEPFLGHCPVCQTAKGAILEVFLV